MDSEPFIDRMAAGRTNTSMLAMRIGHSAPNDTCYFPWPNKPGIDLRRKSMPGNNTAECKKGDFAMPDMNRFIDELRKAWRDEKSSALIYAASAEKEPDPRRRDIFLRMAAEE